MSNIKFKITTPVLMWVIVIAGGIILWKIVPQGRLFYSGMWGMAVLALGFLDWIYVMAKAARVHRKAPQSVQNIDQLVTEGAYAVVRHPIYAADIVLAWCAFIAFPLFKILAVAIWLTLVLFFWAALEERMLEEKFLEDYREYKKRVPMFLPRLFKRK